VTERAVAWNKNTPWSSPCVKQWH